ncbi:MAG: hypothetical protein GW763_01990 [Paraglaciecola sp.]|nr:hypothetical protein [Paraglaciecola sp.]NCT46757.1 hypothetical protein [Paraglaciecola sp.]
MPYRLSTDDLTTLGQVKLADELQEIPFSAHPHTDQNGCIWNIGDLSYVGQAGFVLYQLSAQGTLLQYKVIQSPRRSYVHDFALTENYIVIYLPPLFPSQKPGTLIESFAWRENEGGLLLLIDKHDLSVKRQIACEAGFVFHFGNCWQQKNTLVINLCWYPDAQVMTHSMNDILHSLASTSAPHAQASQIVIDLNTGKVARHALGVAMEFPQYDSRCTTKTSRYQFGVTLGTSSSDTKQTREFSAVSRIDLDSGQTQRYDFKSGTICEEPLFIAKQQGQEGQGFLLLTSLDYANGHTQVSVLDAENVSDGPLAQARLPYYLPLGFHGAYI